MRTPILILALAVAAPIGLWAGSASAQFFEGQSFFSGRRIGPQEPWCANLNSGADRVEEDCSFRSFEHCRQAVMGGNNGFCTQNPRYDVNARPVRARKAHRKRR